MAYLETDEVPHRWIHQTDESGTNKQRNFSFRKDSLYSYSTVIARWVKHKGNRCVFLTNRYYSSTTNRHIHSVRSAIPGYPIFELNDVGMKPYEAFRELKKKVKDLLAEYNNPLNGKCKQKNRVQRLKDYDSYLCAVETLQRFADFFEYKLVIKWPENHTEMAQAIADHNISKEVRRSFESKISLEKVKEQWRAGSNKSFKRLRSLTPMLRLNGDLVQTSYGAIFPLADALAIRPLIEKALESGKAYKGGLHRLGHYTFDGIDEDGTVHAGCHHIPKEEILHFISLLS